MKKKIFIQQQQEYRWENEYNYNVNEYRQKCEIKILRLEEANFVEKGPVHHYEVVGTRSPKDTNIIKEIHGV